MYHVSSNFKIGDTVETSRVIESLSGYFDEGTEVIITGISERGYDIKDKVGNEIIETGFCSIRKIR